jgi:hypothetical protein
MGLVQETQQTFLASVRTNNVRMVSVAAVTPASGAPGAWAVAIADAALAVDYWLYSLSFDSQSAAAIFDYDVATPQAGTTLLINSLHLEAIAIAAASMPFIVLPIPILIPVSATNGLAIRQATASGQTMNVMAAYLTGLGT